MAGKMVHQISKKEKNVVVRAASKTSAAYWKNKVYLEKKDAWISANYFVRIQAAGTRRKVRLEASVLEDAAREALAFYLDVRVNGWPAEEHPTPAGSDPENGLSDPSVRDWIELAKRHANVRQETIEKYAESFLTVVGEILGMRRARKKEDREKIANTKLAVITKPRIQNWINSRLELARLMDPVKANRAKNTIRALVGNANGLFSKHIIESTEGMGFAAIHPFSDLKLPRKFVPKYSSRFDPVLLLRVARKELGRPPARSLDREGITKYEQWKILYLALVGGLRYNEIDKLRIQDISTATGKISVRTHEDFRPKTTESEGDVLVGATACKVIKTMLEHADGPWFLREQRSKTNKSYRAGQHHDNLVKWLRNYEERGFRPFAEIPKPVHELRKEAGTLVNNLHGLNETKNFLRHSSITTTATYYVGSKGDITTGLS
ncbi:MAG: site-specific integrase [Luteolibacter sp.]|uniref:site-specific integrase n=1 Tax=Luteolibacter sp. TaxID=1962973 RepID=UPI0032661411